jgi:oxygen-dependent protoporphyrinogen oxidase
MSGSRREVVVVGSGIAGLSAAWQLTGAAAGPDAESPHVTILEAGHRPGGKLSSLVLDGRIVDAGPDGALARRPELADLCAELGIEAELRPIAASGATIFARGRLRELPADLALGVPTRWSSLRRSKVLSRRGSLRALRDVLLPVPSSRGHLQDRTIGSLVGTKLGDEVVTTLVDPMVGGINAGRVAEMSAAAAFPPLLEAGQERGSLMKAMRALAPPSAPEGQQAPPAFVSLEGGMHRLVEALVEQLETRGVSLRCGAEADSLVHLGGARSGWSINTATTATTGDAAIIAVPTAAAATLLGPLDPEAASLLSQIDYASVAIATFELSEDAIELPPAGTGVLVPPGSRIPGGGHVGQRFMTTALTFLDRKWPHLKREGRTLLRVHCGRIDDERIAGFDDTTLIGLLFEELSELLAVSGPPAASALQRWEEALPQYRVNHLMRVAGIESAIARLGGIEIAGAAYHGVGVPACIASGRAAADRTLEALAAAAR